MIAVTGLSKAYGAVQALQDVHFNIADGEIVGLLGPNGAGKTTIIKILTGYLQPDTGVAVVDGLNVLTQPREVQARIGYLPENAPLYPELSVQAYLMFMADLRQLPESEARERLAEAVLATGLQQHLTRRIGELSKGFRQRVGLAQAILHRPRLLILDEPTVGLDPTQIVEIRRLIKRLSQHSTILFSTHILSEVEALCDRVIMLMRGQIRLDARLDELAQRNRSRALLLLDNQVKGVEKALRQLHGVEQVEPLSVGALSSTTQTPPAAYRIAGAAGVDLCPAIYRLAVESGWPVRELKQDVETLETIFNQVAMAA